MTNRFTRAALVVACLFTPVCASAQDAATIARFALGAAAGSLAPNEAVPSLVAGTFVRFCAGGLVCSISVGESEVVVRAASPEGVVACEGQFIHAGEAGRLDQYLAGLGSLSIRQTGRDTLLLRAPSGACRGAGLSGTYRLAR